MYRLENPDTEIRIGNCLDELQRIEAGSVDLVFADPPFNWEVQYDQWDDGLPRDEYLKFTCGWLDRSINVLRPGGALWVNIPDDTAAEIVIHLKGRGLELHNWCIWHFRFGQCRDTGFITSKVHALYFYRPGGPRTWNPQDILVPSDRATLYNDPRTRNTRNPGRRVPLDVWYGPMWGRVQGNSAERRPLHRNQLPEVYLERVIRACTNQGDLVVDPFCGSGTTPVVARALGRRAIAIEYSPEYAASAFERVVLGVKRVQAVGGNADAAVGCCDAG